MRSVLFLSVCAPLIGQQVTFVDKLPGGENRFYQGNRVPLAPSPLTKLPIGAVQPLGWLRKQLVFEADGFSGRLTELSRFCKFQGNAWTSPTGQGEFGWEEVPYWLKGFTDLGYVLDDKRIIAEANRWLDAVLKTQRENGYFGHAKNLDVERGEQPEMNADKPDRIIDLWPNMIMMYPLRTLYEATGDPRVLPFLTKYFRWQQTIPAPQFLPGSWQKYRGGDNLDSILWLYNRTGDDFLLDLARFNHERTANWFANIPTWHGVNISQGFREPAEFFQVAKDSKFLAATERDYRIVMDDYGQVPGGMFGADENARSGYTGPRQGAETCSMAEFMLSDEMLLKISGDPVWADREEVAFNSLPASMTPDLKGLHYLTAANQVQLDRKNKSPMIENEGDMFSYNPYQYRCCQHNVAHAWPYFAEHLWMASPDGGLALTLYVPSKVKAKVGVGSEIEITEDTEYPFDGRISLSLAAKEPVRFPLALRIPGWTSNPKLKLNGRTVPLPETRRGWLILERNWRNGDRVELQFPMMVEVRTWTKNRNSVSVYRGPLAYSLTIGERWERYNPDEKWAAYEVFPTTAWNYALVLDAANPASSVKVLPKKYDVGNDQPFTPKATPVSLLVRARRLDSWTLEPNGMVGKVPESPVRTEAGIENVTLIPMGCARLRISAFPVAH
jgi:DUF1680 family protein